MDLPLLSRHCEQQYIEHRYSDEAKNVNWAGLRKDLRKQLDLMTLKITTRFEQLS